MPLRPQKFIEFSARALEDVREETRESHAAIIRTYWKQYKGLPPEERWCRILADDRAAPQQWLAAARAIIQPTSVPVSLESVTHGWGRDWWRPENKRKMHGEVLRRKSNPSVEELMAKRVRALNGPRCELLAKRRKMDEQIEKLARRMEKLNEPELSKLGDQKDELEKQRDELIYGDDQDWWMPFQEGCDMAFCLAQWDPKLAMTILREQIDLCRQAIVDSGKESPPRFKECLECILRVRADIGDREALDELRKGSTEPPETNPLR
jgi:hypothetical protein